MFADLIEIIIGKKTLPVDEEQCARLISYAKAHHVLARLAHEHKGAVEPESPIEAIFEDALVRDAFEKRSTLYEIDRLMRACFKTGLRPIVLKGGAYVILGSAASRGRRVSDLDVLIEPGRLDVLEEILGAHGWQADAGTDNADDQRYYRQEMHEIPPLRHVQRKTVLDVHFALNPRRARYPLNLDLMIADAVAVPENKIRVLSPVDRFCHAAYHAFLDGEFSTPARSVIEIYDLYQELDDQDKKRLFDRASEIGALRAIEIAIWVLRTVFAIQSMKGDFNKPHWLLRFFILRALKPQSHHHNYIRLYFIIRGHYLRAPVHRSVWHLVRKYLWVRPVKSFQARTSD